MKKYCFDTSGLSNPLETMPEDIHETMWNGICGCIESGIIAVTTEIYDELCHLPGSVGACINKNKKNLILEVGDLSWDSLKYIEHCTRMQDEHKGFISEYIGGSSKTICLNDVTIIAQAKTLGLPVVSMESRVPDASPNKRRIPNICELEQVLHISFSHFLRAEKLKF